MPGTCVTRPILRRMTTKCNSIQIKSLLFLSNSVPLNFHRSRQLAVWHGQAYIFCGLYYCKTSCVQKISHNKLCNCLSIKILRNKHVEVLDPIVRTSDTDGGGYRTGSWQARKRALYFRTNAANHGTFIPKSYIGI